METKIRVRRPQPMQAAAPEAGSRENAESPPELPEGL